MAPPAREQLARGIVSAAAVAAAAASSAAAPAQPSEPPEVRAFKPVADTYVSSASPHANFGRARVLRVDRAPETTTYLRFELKNLRGTADGITLLLHSNRGTRTSYEVRRVRSEEWSERELTFENAPRVSLRYASSRVVRRSAWSAVDVTALVGEDEDVSLAITTRSARTVAFGSRESRYGPRLAVQLEPDIEDPDIEDPVVGRLRRK